jgi:hypothetical protein
MFKGSKTELNEGTNRTAGTADTIHKTYDSSNNSKQAHAMAKNSYPKPPTSGGIS